MLAPLGHVGWGSQGTLHFAAPWRVVEIMLLVCWPLESAEGGAGGCSPRNRVFCALREGERIVPWHVGGGGREPIEGACSGESAPPAPPAEQPHTRNRADEPRRARYRCEAERSADATASTSLEVVEEDVGILGEELVAAVKARGHGDGHRAEGAGAVDVERRIADHDDLVRAERVADQRVGAAGGERREQPPVQVIGAEGADREVPPEPGAARA